MVLGPESPSRAALTVHMIGRGYAVFLCGSVWDASYACPLLREERCGLAERADAVAILSGGPDELASEALDECAASSARLVVVPDTIAPPRRAVVATSAEPSAVAEAVDALLARGAFGPIGPSVPGPSAPSTETSSR